MVEKILPHNLDAERAVLGAMLRDPTSLGPAFEVLGSDGFYHTGHMKIYLAIQDLYMKGEPTDIFSLSEELRQRNQLEEVGGTPYLGSLLHSVATSAHLEHHARIVKDKSLLRTLIENCLDTAERGFQELGSGVSLVDDMQQSLLKISHGSRTTGFRHVGDLLEGVLGKIEKVKSEKNTVTGVPTGYDDLDGLTAGFQRSDLIILAARPSVGKTSLALNMALNAALNAKVPVGIYSLEMNAEEILERMLCSTARIDLSKVKNGFITNEEFENIISVGGMLSSSPIYIDDSPNMPITDIFTRAIRLKAEEPNLGLLVLDYLQLITSSGTGRRSESRQQEVADYSRSLKSLARELDLPVMVLSQLSRASEKRSDDPTPRLSDLRDSGAIEQDADVVMFLYQEKTAKRFVRMEEGTEQEDTGPNENIVNLAIAKQRNGPRDTVRLYFCREYTRFENLSYEEPPF